MAGTCTVCTILGELTAPEIGIDQSYLLPQLATLVLLSLHLTNNAVSRNN